MDPDTIGKISGALVFVSAIPYGLRTWQDKIHPNLTSWGLWSLIAITILLTFRSSGADANVWPAVLGAVNPTLITILVIRQHGKLTKLNTIEVSCLLLGLTALALWAGVRTQPELAQYALYLSIIADGCAAVPTAVIVWKDPSQDRPFAWVCFAVAYGLSMFAITDFTIANFSLPLYMLIGASTITYPLIRYRWQRRIRLLDWI